MLPKNDQLYQLGGGFKYFGVSKRVQPPRFLTHQDQVNMHAIRILSSIRLSNSPKTTKVHTISGVFFVRGELKPSRNPSKK